KQDHLLFGQTLSLVAADPAPGRVDVILAETNRLSVVRHFENTINQFLQPLVRVEPDDLQNECIGASPVRIELHLHRPRLLQSEALIRGGRKIATTALSPG